MKITGNEASIQALHAAQQARTVEQGSVQVAEQVGLQGSAGLQSGGTVHLSQRAEEVQQIRDIAKAEPEVRTEIVEQAKADLAAGQLTADPMELAAAIARDLF